MPLKGSPAISGLLSSKPLDPNLRSRAVDPNFVAEHKIRITAQRLQLKLEVLAITSEGSTKATNLKGRYEQQSGESCRRERVERKVTQVRCDTHRGQL